ncbi:hydrogenase [Erythrobacter litoralis]|uniref:hypothetical protein n=1 Tax=Erythrobacter litoralis TaxID=39960 RepID=UPI0024360872|nr:hypothetical protein [Erythrobacter litoralis]MDG6079054.1 hydrogenase [Erythrobacter litoralis]
MARSLVISGAVLFLLGLLQGGLLDLHSNPRMALSAHLTAVQSGTALIAAGAVWELVDLQVKWDAATRLLLIVSMFGLWSALTLAAVIGASEALALAGAGYEATATGEGLVTLLVTASSVAMVVGWSVFLVGLIRGRVR